MKYPLTYWARSGKKWALSALVAAALIGCGTKTVNPVTGREERSVMSEQDEVREGAKAHQEVLKEYGVLKNDRVQNYVNDIGQRLAKLSHRNQLKWTFTVLDSPEINAFALPGGYVYITRGIMAYLDSEADLAGVVGHEIGHVTARHGAQRATRQQMQQRAHFWVDCWARYLMPKVAAASASKLARPRKLPQRAMSPNMGASRSCRRMAWVRSI